MKYPIGPDSLAKFCRVRVNVSDEVVREFRKSLSQTKVKTFHVRIDAENFNHDIKVIDSNGLVPVVIIEQPNDAGSFLENFIKNFDE